MPNNLKAASERIKKKYFGRYGVHRIGQNPPQNLLVAYVDTAVSDAALGDLRAAMADDVAEFGVRVEVRRGDVMKVLGADG